MRAQDNTAPALRIGLFNIKFSSNLGDGILSECLEAELQRAEPGALVVSLDLAGRQDYGDGERLRTTALAILKCSPAFARSHIVESILGYTVRSRLRPLWKKVLHDLDAVVVGGGNLFADSDLNFPLKLDGALAEVRGAGLPAAVFGVGVSDNWSSRAAVLFRRALSGVGLVYASVREPRSGEIWTKRLGSEGLLKARIVRDPGLLVSEHVPRKCPVVRDKPLVGIGLTHPMTLRYHSRKHFNDAELTAWVTDLVRSGVRRGWRLVLFANGSPDDDDYLRSIAPSLIDLERKGLVSFMPRFHRPAELAAFIATLDLLMAHRLHANTTAYSYAIPHIGFAWDEKLMSFFITTGRERFMCEPGVASPDQVSMLGQDAMDEGIDPALHRSILTAAREDVIELVETLRVAVLARNEARLRHNSTPSGHN